ncbi:hypothetical protein COHA_009135 [Chlorella ohadii]|uniref:Uncharacterized protein n=1 Tax=Chlorella ohadii TaxID=2649997 RepID=A0AAD5DMG1_9CHLO|nr:hypothetical protein COHA_009135 [Chlorella ohadii]
MGAEGPASPRDVDQEALRTFGRPAIDTQGPAGSRVPDLDDRPRRPAKFGGEDEEAWRYAENSDAPPDAVGPVPPVDAEMTEADFEDPAGDAAAAAVMAARRQGHNSSSQMLDALEAAEAAFEQQEAAAEQQRQIDRIASIKGGAGPGASAAAAAAAAAAAMAVPPPDTPRKAAIAPISEGTRERIISALYEALQANPRYCSEPSRSVMCWAQEVEDALFARSHSKQVYLAQVANAVRLARTAENVSDIPRIAAGEPRAVAEGHTAGEPTPYVTGLQVLKPTY